MSHFNKSTIGKYKLGAVVVRDGKVGHITGFSTNSTDEVIIEVKWCNGMHYTIHIANVELLD